MFHIGLFIGLGLLLSLFAVSAARAGTILVAVPAAILALWFMAGAIQSIRVALRSYRRRNAQGS